MLEERRMKREGQRGLRINEYWLESRIVETNPRSKAQNSSRPRWAWQNLSQCGAMRTVGLAKLSCGSFPSLGTTGIHQHSHHSFFRGSPAGKPPRAAQDETTTEEVPWNGWHNWICQVVVLETGAWMYLQGWEWLRPGSKAIVTRKLET